MAERILSIEARGTLLSAIVRGATSAALEADLAAAPAVHAAGLPASSGTDLRRDLDPAHWVELKLAPEPAGNGIRSRLT